jgi:amino acid permease
MKQKGFFPLSSASTKGYSLQIDEEDSQQNNKSWSDPDQKFIRNDGEIKGIAMNEGNLYPSRSALPINPRNNLPHPIIDNHLYVHGYHSKNKNLNKSLSNSRSRSGSGSRSYSYTRSNSQSNPNSSHDIELVDGSSGSREWDLVGDYDYTGEKVDEMVNNDLEEVNLSSSHGNPLHFHDTHHRHSPKSNLPTIPLETSPVTEKNPFSRMFSYFLASPLLGTASSHHGSVFGNSSRHAMLANASEHEQSSNASSSKFDEITINQDDDGDHINRKHRSPNQSSHHYHRHLTKGSSSSSTIPSEPKRSTSSLLSCVINLTSTIIGAGILGIPYAFSKFGWILGSLFLIACSSLSFFGLHLLSECSRRLVPSHQTTFYQIAELTIPRYSRIVDVAIMTKGIGVATSYLIVINDSLPSALAPYLSFDIYNILFGSRATTLLLAYLIVVPLSYFPRIDSLKYSSFLSLIMIVFLVCLIALYALFDPSKIAQQGIWNPCLGLDHRLLTASFSSLWYTSEKAISAVDYKAAATATASSATAICQKGVTEWINSNLYAHSSSKLYFFQYFPIFLFSYTCQQNTYNIINELERPTYFRVNLVFLISIVLTLGLYLSISYAAYVTYGNTILSDVLTLYPSKSPLFLQN